MIVIPTIEVQGGRCVRPVQADPAPAAAYAGDPSSLARWCIDEGAPRIHVVDVDAARGIPTSESATAVGAIVDMCVAAAREVEVGGGVRSVEVALRWLGKGASLVVLGSVAAREPEVAVQICEATDGRVVLALDVRADVARVEGWTEDGLAATELLRLWRGWRSAGLVYTDTTRDGLMTGPNLDGLQICRDLFGDPVIIAGGIGSLDDMAACAAAGAAGVLVGRALQEGRVDLAAALEAFTTPGGAPRSVGG